MKNQNQLRIIFNYKNQIHKVLMLTVKSLGIHVLFFSGIIHSSIPFLWNWIPVELKYLLVPIHKVS
jgi:hypothetical protein